MRVLLGVGGSVAAHRALDLASELTKAGDEVDVVPTRGAQEFVRPLHFQALTRRKVFADLFEAPTDEAHDHLRVATSAEVFVVAPATADLLAKFAAGIADDFLTTAHLAYRGPKIVAPAMNWRMWSHPSVERNCATLRAEGWTFVGPAEGDLACGERGPGRLAPVAEILAAIRAAKA